MFVSDTIQFSSNHRGQAIDVNKSSMDEEEVDFWEANAIVNCDCHGSFNDLYSESLKQPFNVIFRANRAFRPVNMAG